MHSMAMINTHTQVHLKNTLVVGLVNHRRIPFAFFSSLPIKSLKTIDTATAVIDGTLSFVTRILSHVQVLVDTTPIFLSFPCIDP